MPLSLAGWITVTLFVGVSGSSLARLQMVQNAAAHLLTEYVNMNTLDPS